jgi:hypothetical protein
MTLERYFIRKLKRAQVQYCRCGAASLINEDGDRIPVDRNTDIEGMEADGYGLQIDIDRIPAFVKKAYEEGILSVGLFEGRHNLPVDKYIFEGEFSPTDINRINATAGTFFGVVKHNWDIPPHTINIFVTGLTSGIVATLSAASKILPKAEIVCWHYDRDTGEYFPQKF